MLHYNAKEIVAILPSVVLILDRNVDIIAESILLSGIGEVDAALQVRSDTVLPFAIGILMSLLCQICFFNM